MMEITPLLPSHIDDLAPRMRHADIIDCAAYDYDPAAALWAGKREGPSWALLDDETGQVMGAVGFAPGLGTIWSLWADNLQPAHRKWIMQNTAAGVRVIALFARMPLVNYVWEDNKLTLAWLRASKCFDIGGMVVPYKGHNYRPFVVKPLEELP